MVDVALESYEIDSSTFVSSLAYIKTFNNQLTYDLVGVVDIGLTAGLATEVAVSGVTTSSVKTLDDVKNLASQTGHYSDDAIEHIFSGNSTGGYHYEGLNDTYAHVTNITQPANSQGVYQATVQYGTHTKTSTFFPKNWTPQQVFDAIEEAYRVSINNAVPWGTRDVIVSSGLKIRILFDGVMNIRNAYPLF